MRALWALALLALAIWAYASQSWAFVRTQQPGVAANGALQFGMAVLFVMAVASAGPPARAIAAVLVVGVIWNGAVAGFRSQKKVHHGRATVTIGDAGVSVLVAGATRWLRPYGLHAHPNLLGGVLAVGLLAALAWILSARRWMRRAGTAAFLFGLWAFLLTFSRSAWLGFAAGAFAMLPLLLRPSKGLKPLAQPLVRALALPTALALITAAAFYVMYRPLISARAGAGEESLELRSVSDRLVFGEFAFRSIQERPLLGVGIANFPWRAASYLLETNYDLQGDHVHHVLLSALAELGAVGFGLTVAALILGVEAALLTPQAKAMWLDKDQRAEGAETHDDLFSPFSGLSSVAGRFNAGGAPACWAGCRPQSTTEKGRRIANRVGEGNGIASTMDGETRIVVRRLHGADSHRPARPLPGRSFVSSGGCWRRRAGALDVRVYPSFSDAGPSSAFR
jgi:hypothetical protein